MTLVTIAEARENLPELLRRAAAGEQIVVTDGEKWLAALGKAPSPTLTLPSPSPDEEAARQTRIKAVIREMVQQMVEAGTPPPAESKIWEVFAEEECR
jgi:antitoxin (DNA-binding transcriptional repressor) of toxin-antitoxin stability system